MSDNVNTILQVFLPEYSRKIHVREIARLTGINRQTVSEILKSMENERLVDSEIVGRQKLYFLNFRNMLTKLRINNTENTIRMNMCKNRTISILMKSLDISSPVVLFGSYAKGTERKDSDIDLLILSNKKYNPERFEKETGKKTHIFHMKPKEFVEGFFRKDTLIAEIVKSHVCLRNTEAFVDLLWEVNYGKRY